MILDFHTHAFPDALAERAMAMLEQGGSIQARLDGKVSSLLRSMDDAGIETSVVASIATKPEQFPSILKWSKAIASARLIPFPSVHPDDPQAAEGIRLIAAEGLQGIKLHPYYQAFDLGEERMLPIYEALARSGLILLCHTGFDFAFPHVRRCDPPRILKIVERFPELKLVTSHLGGWRDWDRVRECLLGKPIYMEISFSIELLGDGPARDLLLAHPQDYLLFGTDSPWAGQKETVAAVRRLGLGAGLEARTFSENARRLLGLSAADVLPPEKRP